MKRLPVIHPSPHFGIVAVVFFAAAQFASAVVAQRGLRDIPSPDPAVERASFQVAEGFDVQLYVSDPDIAKPIHMNFDAQGRLWIASSEVYPHIKPGQPATDKILVVEDRDRDGVADRTTVFADGLLIPTGVVPGDGGAYVVNSTELIHLEDVDGDLRGDVRNVVLSGFGSEDTHHLLHSLRWGPDGALYMNQSIYIHSHVETPAGVRRLRGGGIWRFRPETMQLEVVCRGFVNPWGHHFDAWGQSFATDGAYGEGINYVFPGAVYVTAPGLKRRLAGLNPGSPKHCGLEILSGRHLPEDWRGTMITNDFRAHRVCRFRVSEDGAGYSSQQESEVITSSHVAFRPIDVKMGPDGAIYIADWYNPIIQHGEVDFRDERRDHVHGRIWRITATGRPLVPHVDPESLSTKQLIKLLQAPEDWTRLHAKLEMKHRSATTVSRQLQRRLEQLDGTDEAVLHEKLEILWAHQNIQDVPTELVHELASAPDHRVRAAALRVAINERTRVEGVLGLLQNAVHDASPRVRLEAIRGLSLFPNADSARLSLEVLGQPMDRFIDFALWQTMRDLDSSWRPGLIDGESILGNDPSRILYALQAVEAQGTGRVLLSLLADASATDERTENLLGLVAELGTAEEVAESFRRMEARLQNATSDKEARLADLFDGMILATARRGVPPSNAEELCKRWLDAAEPQSRIRGALASGLWKQQTLRPQLINILHALDSNALERQTAVTALGLLADTESLKALKDLAESTDDDELLGEIAVALAPGTMPASVSILVRLAQSTDDRAFQRVFTELIQRQGGQAAVHKGLTAVRAIRLSTDTAKRLIRNVQSTDQPDTVLLSWIRAAGGLTDGGWDLTPVEKRALLTTVMAEGDPARGELIYRRSTLSCVKCHAIAGAGGRVGPDLISIGGSAPLDYLLESLLQPNAKVKENYHSLVVLTDDGKLVHGIPIREDESTLVLRDKDNSLRSIPKSAIEGRRQGRSLMPDGTVDELTREELIDLVSFLSMLGKPGPFAIGTRQFVRHWSVLKNDEDSRTRVRRVGNASVLQGDPAFEWLPAYSQVGGHLPVTDLDSIPRFPDGVPVTFLRTRIRVNQSGPLRFQLSDPAGLSIWIGTRPIAAESRMEITLQEGRHDVVIAIDRAIHNGPLHLELLSPREADGRARWEAGR